MLQRNGRSQIEIEFCKFFQLEIMQYSLLAIGWVSSKGLIGIAA